MGNVGGGHNHPLPDINFSDADLVYTVADCTLALQSPSLLLLYQPYNHFIQVQQLLVLCLLIACHNTDIDIELFVFSFAFSLCYFITFPFQQPSMYLTEPPLLLVVFNLSCFVSLVLLICLFLSYSLLSLSPLSSFSFYHYVL